MLGKRRNAMRRITLAVVLFIASAACAEQKIRIVTWNVRDILKEADLAGRDLHIKAIASDLKPDILCLQEITSLTIAERIRDAMGSLYQGYHVACSDFVQSDAANRSAFEVAIISKFPFTQVIEFDPSPDNNEAEDDPEELPVTPLLKIGIQGIGTSRGYLWAHIEQAKLTVAVVHLKSSRGSVGFSDRKNAKKRELVAGALAAGVVEDKGLFPGYSFLVAGDFNVGHSDAAKNGVELAADCYNNCDNRDRYDETHALLGAGLVSGLKMKNLTLSITTSTYPTYPGSPIDNIYVDGADKDKFSDAQTGTSTYGSDHLPVWTVLTRP